MVPKKFKIKKREETIIELEEILLDAPLYKDPQNPKAYLETHLESLIPGFIFYVLLAIFVISGFFILYQPASLQVENKVNFLAAAEKNFGRVYPITAPRGIFYDRNFQI